MRMKKLKKIILRKNFARVTLSQKKFAKIDLSDVARVKKHCWFYAIDHARAIINGRSVRLHNFIMRMTKKSGIHFKNGNLLDFRKHNLELVSLKFIHQKKGKISTPTTSQFKGVSWHMRSEKWEANIKKNQVRKHLGTFENESNAALAYNEAALKYFGTHAFLNNI